PRQLPAQPPAAARVDRPERSIHPSSPPAPANLTTGWLPPARLSPVGRAFFPPRWVGRSLTEEKENGNSARRNTRSCAPSPCLHRQPHRSPPCSACASRCWV